MMLFPSSLKTKQCVRGVRVKGARGDRQHPEYWVFLGKGEKEGGRGINLITCFSDVGEQVWTTVGVW